MTQPLSERCKGRWFGILTGLGVDARHLNGKHGPCPICNNGTDRFRYDDKDGRGTWFCSKCGAGDGVALVMRSKGVDFKGAADLIEGIVGRVQATGIKSSRDERALRDAMNRLWTMGITPKQGDPVWCYMENRGIILSEWPKCIRYVDRCRYQDDAATHWPAMIARVTAADGTPSTIHRTYLTSDGKKAPVMSPRRLMPGKIDKGCAIRLAPSGPVLGIAEGIETALSASKLWSVPVWAAVSAGMLMAWVPPEGVKEVIVFGDNDTSYAGQSAAFALAHRLSANGVRVRVELPPDPGMDWNDCLMADLRAQGV